MILYLQSPILFWLTQSLIYSFIWGRSTTKSCECNNHENNHHYYIKYCLLHHRRWAQVLALYSTVNRGVVECFAIPKWCIDFFSIFFCVKPRIVRNIIRGKRARFPSLLIIWSLVKFTYNFRIGIRVSIIIFLI